MRREKKTYVVLTFSTTTAAMEMEQKCEAGQIPGRLIPVPRQISAGCGMAWRMLPQEYEKYQKEIDRFLIPFQGKWEIEL